MPITNPTITAQRKTDIIITGMLAREAEIHAYQVNIDNYTSMLSALPSAWPEELVRYRGQSPQQIASQNISAAEATVLSSLLLRDRVSQLLTTEIIHQGTAQGIYDALAAQVDPAQLPSLLAAAAAEDSTAAAAE